MKKQRKFKKKIKSSAELVMSFKSPYDWPFQYKMLMLNSLDDIWNLFSLVTVVVVVVLLAFVTNHVCYLILRTAYIHTYSWWPQRLARPRQRQRHWHWHRQSQPKPQQQQQQLNVTICHSIKRPIQVHSHIMLDCRKINLVTKHFKYLEVCMCVYVAWCVRHINIVCICNYLYQKRLMMSAIKNEVPFWFGGRKADRKRISKKNICGKKK